MDVKNAASALGEAIGKIIENELEKIIRPICEEYGYLFDRGGERPEKRKGVKLSMINKSGNHYQLDGVIETADGNPILLLESKYLRYKKHNRDKASWTCASHYQLRKSYPTIRKSIAVLSGNWSLPSKKFLESFGIELYEISFSNICDALMRYGIEFNWHEKDNVMPVKSWNRFQELSANTKEMIGQELLACIKQGLIESIMLTLRGGEDWAKRLKEIELLLKTNRNEYMAYRFETIRDAMSFLINLQEESTDLRGKL